MIDEPVGIARSEELRDVERRLELQDSGQPEEQLLEEQLLVAPLHPRIRLRQALLNQVPADGFAGDVRVVVEITASVDHALGDLGLALDDGRGAATARERIEEHLRRLAAHDHVRHGIGVTFVRIAGAMVDPAAELDAGALLHDVRGFVGGRVEIGGASERDVIARRERPSAELAGGGCGGPIGVRTHGANVVATKAGLDPVEE